MPYTVVAPEDLPKDLVPEEIKKPAGKYEVVDPGGVHTVTVDDLVAMQKKNLRPQEAMSRGAATGATLGMFNRGLGLWDYLRGNAPSYSQGVDINVAKEAELAKENPGSHFTGTLAGAAATGYGTAGSGLTLAKAGMPLFDRVAVGALEGGAQGAAAGAGNTYTGNPMDYLHGAAQGAVLGTSVGGVAPAAVAGAGLVAGKAVQPFNFFRDPSEVARDRVTKAMLDARNKTAAGINTDVQSAEAAGQPGYSIVDAIGKPAQRELAVVAKQPGPARDLVDTTLTPRNEAAPMRRAGEIDKALGVQGTAKQAEAALLEKAQTEAAPLYEKAMTAGPITNDVIAEGLKHPIMKSALTQGAKLQSIENAMTGKPFEPTDIGGVPNMRTLQTAKMGLDQMIESSFKDGRPTTETRALTGFKNRLLEQIDALNPDYAKARATFAGPMAVRDAVQEGAEGARSTARFADVLDEFRAKDPNQQQGYRIGVANALNAQLERGQTPSMLLPRSQQGTNVLNELSLYQGPNKPVPGAALTEPNAGGVPGENPWRTFMNREDQMARTNKQALGGSPTFENFADANAQQSALLKAGGSLARGDIKGALGNAWELAKSAGRGETAAQRDAIARMLLLNSSQGEEYQALIRHLAEIEAQKNATAFVPTASARGLTAAAVGAAPYLRRQQ